VAALKTVAETEAVPASLVNQAISQLKIDPERADPWRQ
jgi:hypothetical protein